MALPRDTVGKEQPRTVGREASDRGKAKGRGAEVTLPRPGLAIEAPAEAEHALLKLTALLDAQVRMTQIILQALEARIVDLNIVRFRWLLVAGWVRGCARLRGVHSEHPFSVGRVPGCANTRGAISVTMPLFYHQLIITANNMIICRS